MGVVIESEIWEPNNLIYIFLFVLCFISIFSIPNRLSPNSNLFDHAPQPSLLRFQKFFLFLFSLSSVMEGLWSVFGEYELAFYGVSREHIILSLSVGYAAALFFGPFLGVLSDLIGQKKVVLIFFILHLFVGIWKRIISHPSLWLASICLSLTNSIFLFSFETWIVVEHDKLGQRQDMVNDMFWLMAFCESASFIGSQMLTNWLIGTNVEKHIVSPSTATMLLAIISIISFTRGWRESPQTATFKDYRISFSAHIFGDKRIWLLAWTQACVHFSVAVFWILWAPTIVADGREVNLGLIYPSLLGARMLGSTTFPWFVTGKLFLRTEDYLVYMFIIGGFVLSIAAYDYQEIGVLVALFCVFHACIGLILPSLARLRTLYVPNELRGGMISVSLAPANAAILFFLMQGRDNLVIGNSTAIALAALGLLSSALCMHMLKRSGKQLHYNGLKS